MPWEEIIVKGKNCILDGGVPTPQRAAGSGVWIGSIYVCDHVGCGRRYMLRNDHSGWFWEEIPTPPPV